MRSCGFRGGHIALWTVLALLALSGCAGAVTVDGGFDDWKDVAPTYVDERPGATDGNHIETVWTVSDQANLYFSVRCSGPIKGADWGPTFVCIDMDRDASTGFQCGSLGVDYFVQPRRDLKGELMIMRRFDGANDTIWSKWDNPTVVAGGYAIGSGDQSNRLEMRIPWGSMRAADPSKAAFRFRICDGSAWLDVGSGSWAPNSRLAYYFVKGTGSMEQEKNLCANGDFEYLQEAAASPLPRDWQVVRHDDPGGTIDASGDAFQGKHSLRLKAQKGQAVGMNSAVVAAGRGFVRLRYKALKSDVDGGNLAICVIGLTGADGSEAGRQVYCPPKEHIGDGQWHEATIDFDFTNDRLHHCLIAPRINEGGRATGDGEWLIDAVEVYGIEIGPKLKLANVWSDKPAARVGDTIRFSAAVENVGDTDAADVSVELKTSAGITVAKPLQHVAKIAIGSYSRVDWSLQAKTPGRVQIDVAVSTKPKDTPITEKASYKILVMDPSAKPTRQELCTDEAGYWRVLERPSTLQQGNTGRLTPIKHKKSSEIKHNTYGVCTHVPRSKDYEDPFNPSHLIDADPETCWSSQQNSSAYPGVSPWAEIDLGKMRSIRQANLIPYWHNTDFPVGFSILTSPDGKTWENVLHRDDYHIADQGEKRGDKIVQPFRLDKPVNARYAKVEFERLPLSGGNYAEVSQGWKARLSGIEVIDETGANVALLDHGATVKASDYFTGWQNTAKTVNESFGRIFDIGFKWVRISQWGDQTEWAAVEREKGVFKVDPKTDAGIGELLDNGVDILYTLDYGNSLYERPEPPGDIGPIYKEGHPFSLNCGPRTEEGRQAFVRYADFVVRKYGNRIKWWELWNEQNGWYPGHEPELYGKFLLAVSKHIKEINPNLKVMVGGTAAPAPITTEIALREGAAPYVDGCAFHPYGIDKPEGGMGTMEYYQGKNLGQSREQTGWNHLEEIVAGVKKPFAQHGKPNVEVWLNEWGTNVTGLDFTYNPGIGEYACAKYMMRFYIYGGWLKLPAAWWALYNMNKSQDWGIIDQDDYGFRP